MKSTTARSLGSSRPMLPGRKFWLTASVVLIVAVGLVYGRSINAPLVFDDTITVADNTSIVRLWPLVGDAGHPGPLNPAADITTSGRPLVNLSLALNYYFGGVNPVGYHVFNLAVHLLSALLLLAIVNRTLRLDYFGGRFDTVAGWLALAATLLWALHPLQTETVVYITQRTELLMGLFYLATLYGSLRYWSADSAADQTKWLVLTTLACLAGMACKEVMVTAPVVVLLFDRTFITGSFRQALRKSWPLYLGLTFGWVLLLALNINAPRSGSAGFHLAVAASDWWLTQTQVLWMYLKLAVWPWPLSIHYEMPYLTTLAAASPWLLPTVLLAVAGFILVWKRKASGFVIVCMLLILSPTFFVPIVTEVAAERRMYLPLAALAAMVVVAGYRLAQLISGESEVRPNQPQTARRSSLGILATMSVLLAVIFGAISMRRLEAYQNPITIWKETLALQPNDATACFNLAMALKQSGQLENALPYYRQAVALKPELAEFHNTLASALLDAGRREEAVEHLTTALQLNPKYAEAHSNLGNALLAEGRTAEAIQEYQQSIKLKPDYAMAHDNLGVALLRAGKLQEAIDEHKEALRLKPDFVDAQNNLGVALMNAGQPAEAIEHYQEVLKSKPDSIPTYVNLALANAKLQKSAEAIAAAEKALQLARVHQQPALAQEIESWLIKYRAANSAPLAPEH